MTGLYSEPLAVCNSKESYHYGARKICHDSYHMQII